MEPNRGANGVCPTSLPARRDTRLASRARTWIWSALFSRPPKWGFRRKAMSQENVEIIRRLLDAFNRLDADAVRGIWSPDAEWRPAFTGGGLIEGAVFRGRQGVSEFLKIARDRHGERQRLIATSFDSSLLVVTACSLITPTPRPCHFSSYCLSIVLYSSVSSVCLRGGTASSRRRPRRAPEPGPRRARASTPAGRRRHGAGGRA